MTSNPPLEHSSGDKVEMVIFLMLITTKIHVHF
jgi:hypothetical protein